LGLKDRELEQLQDRWHEETRNIHQQTREEINSEREKLIKVIVVRLYSLLDCDTVVFWAGTNISEEHSASVIRVEGI